MSYKDFCALDPTGTLKTDWIKAFARGVIANPGINKIDALRQVVKLIEVQEKPQQSGALVAELPPGQEAPLTDLASVPMDRY